MSEYNNYTEIKDKTKLDYKDKYVKYKTKYLELKKSLDNEQNKIIKHGVVYAAQIVELKALWINIHSEQLYMVTLLFTSSTGRIVRGRTTVWARIAKQLVELSEAKKTINILYYPNILHFVALPVNNMFPGIPFYKLKSE